MALIICPECGKEVSDKASVCIGCGYPIESYKKNEDREDRVEKEKAFERKNTIKEIYWCRNCYRQNDIGVKKCIYCGNDLILYSFVKYNEEELDTFLDKLYYSENGEKNKIVRKTRMWF